VVAVVAHGNHIPGALASARAVVRRAVSATVAPWSPQSAAVVTAILIGDRAGLDDEMQRHLQEAGTYHVIAISGGNIAIFTVLIVMLLRRARIGPRASAIAVVCALISYALLVGGGSSVGRATLMAGMGAVVLAHINAHAALWTGFIAHLGVRGLLASASLVELMPWVARRVPPPALVVMAGYYSAVIAVFFTRGGTRVASAAVAAVCGWWIVAAPVMAFGPTPLRV